MKPHPDLSLLQEVALETGITEAFVEKDWFVVQVIAAIHGIDHRGFEVVFSGGTALSKAHGLLQRFSEDVDFRLRVPESMGTRRILSGYKRAVIEVLRQQGFAIDDANVRARDENRFFAVELDYESLISRPDSLRPHIQLEFTAREPQMPPLYKSVASFISTLTRTPPEIANIACIDPVESAADKLSALCWRIPDRRRGDPDDDPAIIRHVHDLALLQAQALANSRFPSLVLEVLKQDEQRPRNTKFSIGLSAVDKFHNMLTQLENDADYTVEYDRFVRGVSYAPEGVTPSFNEAIALLKNLIMLFE
ncbi:MAG: nucleotidyl transferase AbiEii/AbiGii toxin family protein [Goleter apudmare HA4340-LM2]|jgi:predicted nucleotidyltransferase component of viral defense system|nr:nucleotidyl transferase AbiEii/AbiGii toxin family protein [Goleter apudmare HA4340-LM2]